MTFYVRGLQVLFLASEVLSVLIPFKDTKCCYWWVSFSADSMKKLTSFAFLNASLPLKYRCLYCLSVFPSWFPSHYSFFLPTSFKTQALPHLIQWKKKIFSHLLHPFSILTLSFHSSQKKPNNLSLGSPHRYFQFYLVTFLSHLIRLLLFSGHVSLLTAQKVQFSVVWLLSPHFKKWS